MRKKFFKILIILGLVGISFLFSSNFAFAFFLVEWTGKAIIWTCGKLAFLFGWLAGVVIDVENYFLRWVLEINFNLMDSLILKRGWEISRDIANLGFALGILIISLATIANYQPYHARRLLARLIIAALLINFSLMICGIFVDFSNSFMKYFADSWGGATKLGEMLQAAVNASAVHKGPPEEAIKGEFFDKKDDTGGFKAALIAVGGMIFAAIFSIILAIVYAALIFLLFIRYVTLAFLIILSPFAWVFWFLPTSLEQPGGIWQKWWKHFLSWNFFGPTMLFVIFLALSVLDPAIKSGTPEMITAQKVDESLQGEAGKLIEETLARSSSPQSGISWLMQYALVVGIILIGMRFSLELSERVGSNFYTAAEGVVKAPGRWIGKKVERVKGGIRSVGMAAAGAVKERIATVGVGKEGRLAGATRRVTAWPGVKKFTREGLEIRQERRERIRGLAKKMEKEKAEEIERYLEAGSNEEKAAALLALLNRKPPVWKEGDKRYEKARQLLKKYGIEHETPFHS